MLQALLGLLLAMVGSVCQAEGTLMQLDSRPGVRLPLLWEAAAQPQGTVLLLTGGAGSIGRIENGRATSPNFLMRNAPLFLARGFNVALVSRPSDTMDLGERERVSSWHMTDLRAAVQAVRGLSSAPLWLVGTSRGTVSAAAAAIAMPEQPLAGLVLTSSVVSYHSIGSLWSQDLASIRLPVLVMHHARDACRVCRPADVPALLAKFSQAPVKKLLMLDGGANPSGDPCEPMHWHGFVGMDQQAVDAIADWMQHPVP